MHLSLWLCPSGKAREAIAEAMKRLRERGGGPAFEPHVTLLEGIDADPADAERRLEALAARVAPLTLELGRIDWRDERFRCLFATVAPGAALTAARRAAEEVFGVVPARPYEPHLSLLYGKLDTALKIDLAASAGGRLEVSFEVAAVNLFNASSRVAVEGWRCFATQQLKRR